MDLDTLTLKFSQTESPVASRLSEALQGWKSDDSSVADLAKRIEQLIEIGSVEKTKSQAELAQLWSSFRREVVDGIGGMTMNERLYLFGLLSHYDACQTQNDRMRLYGKLNASP
ncbi:MAG: hypothetical protein AAF358_26390 [Pseudomonadota bacterium]